MQQNKNAPASFDTLTGRLAFCAEKVGGKRPLAAAGGISEAQLFRYLSGESDIPSERLVALAKAAAVAPGWLLTGQGETDALLAKNLRQPFKPELLQRVAQVLDEVLVEYPQRLTPRLKSHYLSFIYEASRFEEQRTGEDWNGSRTWIVTCLDYLTAIRDEKGLKFFSLFVQANLTGQPLSLSLNETEELSQMLALSVASRFNGPSGELDFRQGTQTVREVGQQRLTLSIQTLIRKLSITPSHLHFLDVGCGNGRDLAFLHSLIPEASWQGVDISKQAVQLCQRLEQANKLLPNTVKLGDQHNLPYPEALFHGVQSRFSMAHTPLLYNHPEVGVLKAFSEIRRVIKTGGLLFTHVFVGQGVLLVPFIQLYEEDDLKKIAALTGFELVEYKVHSAQDTLNKYGSKQQLENYLQTIGSATFVAR